MQSFVSQENFESHWRLFDEMMNRFNLNATKIAADAGISRVILSRFRHGKADLGAAKLIALLLVLPQEARTWYLCELFGIKTEGTSLRTMVEGAAPEEQVEVLRLIADSLAKSHLKNFGTNELPQAV
ncbi:MAG: XRE family transcriptional regulator [Calothrix sp. C42_A2020_038]|nr:XRE family transcriptional regulator [Calothrix sp. C42_A2020_038]